jgi:hypothetical protein
MRRSTGPRPAVVTLIALALVLMAQPGAAIEPDPEPTWGISVLGGIGGGGQEYEIMVDTPRGWEDDDSFVTQWQWFADVRLHAPPLSWSNMGARPFLVAGYSRGFGSDETLHTVDPIARSDVDVKFKDRWTVGLGISFPIERSGRTFMEVNPSLSYGRERARAEYDLTGSFGQRSFSDSLDLDQVVPALELSFPVAPLGDVGNAHIAVGGQLPINVGKNSSTTGFVPLDGQNWAVGTFERDTVGFAAYVALRLSFDMF